MAHYVIGDLQGCLAEFKELLAKLAFNPGNDTLWLTGDLVNRGPASLETLRFVKQHDTCMQTVLGNHDLHLLALYYGYGKLKRGDTINDILTAPDKKVLLDWLRAQPLLLDHQDWVMVHAGIWPQWTISQAKALAKEVNQALITTPAHYFEHMYGNKPRYWQNTLDHDERLRFVTNVFTRMRALTRSGKLDFDYKGTLKGMPAELTAWFNAPDRQNLDVTILFGHWSALGLHRQNHTICLDTGALWGDKLTALNLENQEVIQIASQTKLNLVK